jgi:hypothetical protein
MNERAADFESLVRQALRPIEPPADLEVRLETRFREIIEDAVGELEGWELSAMRDPRNWVRPVVAAGVGTAAGVGLVLVRTQRKRHRRRDIAKDPLDLAERTLRDLAHETSKLLKEANRRLR